MSTPKKILILDDDERNIFALKAMLVSRKFECVAATHGEEALHILHSDRDIKVALVDIMLPGMDGYEVLSRIRENQAHQSLKLVAVTAQAMPGDREKCLKAGADEYISKPINVDTLLQYLSSI